MAKSSTPALALRWVTLGAVLANVAWNYISQSIDFGAGSMRAISERYHNLFMPAPYAFSIWGLIYAAMIAFCVVQLLPSQRSRPFYDVLDPPLVAANAVMSIWIIAFRSEQLGLSVLLIAGALYLAVHMFRTAHAYVADGGTAKLRLTIPFSLLAGWLSVATIANVTLWIVAMEGRNFGLGAWRWAAIMIGVAFLLSGLVAQRFRDVVFPLVIAWALLAIAVRDRAESLTISNFAYLAATGSFIVAVWAAYRRALLRLPRFTRGGDADDAHRNRPRPRPHHI